MRRVSVLLSIVAIVLVGIVALRVQPGAVAQEATPTTMSGHPLVGTWLLDTNADDPANAPEVTIFTADGAYISVDAEGFPNHGVWEATGERTAGLTIVSPGDGGGGIRRYLHGAGHCRSRRDRRRFHRAVHRRVRQAGRDRNRGVRPGDGDRHPHQRRGDGDAGGTVEGLFEEEEAVATPTP